MNYIECKIGIEAILPGTNVRHLLKEARLIVSDREVSIKVEVNKT